MRCKLNKKYIKVWELYFNEDFPQINYRLNLPLLIDNSGMVILGNSMKNILYPLEKIECIIMNKDIYLSNSLYNIEKEIVLENSQDRLYLIEKELKEYINSFNDDYEVLTLFELQPDTRLISKENYIDPGEYDFVKHNIVDRNKNEGEENAGIFSDFGEY